jgi:group I intron endonuclease
MQSVYIYTLRDPKTEKVRYVGKTIQNPKERLYSHIREAKRNRKSYRDKWILQVLARDQRPIIEVIEESNEENWQERERFWIAEYKERGYNLTNVTKGGEGLHGYKFSKEHKQKLSDALKGNNRWLGKKHTEETKRKMSKNMRGENNPNYGKRFSKEYRQKLSDAQRGRKHTEKVKKKISHSAKGNTYGKGYKQTEEHKRKIAEARAKKKLEKQKKVGQKPLFDDSI